MPGGGGQLRRRGELKTMILLVITANTLLLFGVASGDPVLLTPTDNTVAATSQQISTEFPSTETYSVSKEEEVKETEAFTLTGASTTKFTSPNTAPSIANTSATSTVSATSPDSNTSPDSATRTDPITSTDSATSTDSTTRTDPTTSTDSKTSTTSTATTTTPTTTTTSTTTSESHTGFFPPGLEVLDQRKETKSPFVLRDPTYLVVAPRLVRAGQVYRLVVNILEPSPSLVVRATIFRDNIELAAVEHECESDAPQVLELMVPPGSAGGKYRLRLEGNELGGLTGSAFTNETVLSFSPKGATVLVQTDKPVYKQGDVVRFRVVALDTAVKMVEDSVDVFILNPRGVLVRRWLSRQCREGPVSLEFPLSSEPEFGGWTIRVEATNSFTQHSFTVEEFHRPRFEVEVRVPSYLSADANYLEGVVVANYSSGAPISGNVTVRAAVRSVGRQPYAQYGPEPALTQPHTMDIGTRGSGLWFAPANQTVHFFAGVFPFKFRMSDFEDLVAQTEGTEVRVTATVGDAYWDVAQSGFASTRIFSASVNLEFLGESPQVFRPAMPFKFYLSATQQDGSKVPEWRLARHRLLVTPEVTLNTGVRKKLISRTVKMIHMRYALWQAEIDLHAELADVEVELEVTSLRLDAELKDSSGARSYASLVSVAHHSPKGRHLQVTTSTRNPKVGEYVILHVRSNFYLEKFRYILLSKGMVIEAGQQSMEASLKTFPLPLTPELAGLATVAIFAAGRDGDLVADALTFPVDALTRKGLDVTMKQQAESQGMKVTVKALPGSRVALAGSQWASYSMQAGNDLTHAMILHQMAQDGSGSRQAALEQRWVSEEGLPENILHLPRTSPGVDPNDTFSYADLVVLSDGVVPTFKTSCMGGPGLRPCLLGGCYNQVAVCDNKFDCPDRIDERGCPLRQPVTGDKVSYRKERASRLSRHYSTPWIWEEVIIGDSGSATLTVPIPSGTSHLALTAFSLHPEHGMAILPEPVQWRGSPGFWFSVEAPGRVGVWEQVGVRVTAVNHHHFAINAIIVLANNPAYKFVKVDGFDAVDPSSGHVQRRMVAGEHEHAVEVAAGETHTLYLPIVPVQLGEITVIVQASLPGTKLQKEITIFVEPLGAAQEFHTSLLLDLSNRAYFFTFLDVNMSDGLVPGSDHAHVAVFGDTVGAVIPDTPATAQTLLGLPTVGCEPVVFSFLMTVLQMRQWKELKQEPQINQREVFRRLALLYQTLLAYQTREGGFKYYRTSQTPSVWVTSLVIRALNEVSVNWSHFLYVDPQVTDKALRYVLGQQARHGAWWEPSGEAGDRKLVPSPYSLTRETTHALNLSTTAHTMLNLIALQELPSPLDERVLEAIARGEGWLEENLALVGRVSRPLEVSLVALALHLTHSAHADTAFGILTRNARQEVKYVYWGEDLVPLPSYRVESQRPHLQPRRPHRHDAGNVAATAYALVTLIPLYNPSLSNTAPVKYVYWGEDLVPLPSYRVESQRPHLQPRRPHRHDAGNVAATAYALRLYSDRGEVMTPSIVRWLQSQRGHDGGWMSTQDSLVAWEALYEYSKRESRYHDTQLTVSVEPLHDHTEARTFFIAPDNLLHLQTHKVGGWWRSVRVQGKGRGAAVLQLTSKYHVSDPDDLLPAPTAAFHLRTRATWHGHNGSALTFTTCTRWLFQEASDASGVAVLEVTVPTGYGASASALQSYVASRAVPNLRRADFHQRKVTFYFEKLLATDTCVEFSVERWFPVANLTKVLPVKVYEYYSPELYEVELLDMSSVTLDICQVCGSYQCPNCPILSYYSSPASSPRPRLDLQLLAVVVTSLLTLAAHLAPS
ncbi:CD109 antigen-like [Penaeus japonicus]|uniref:CD109 antigen-like n=1 Tax=Penaeus japonicus TaxID=27405 RepID=UPI001C714666|nr:CD109 antigen-like [Penaeus japonicus]